MKSLLFKTGFLFTIALSFIVEKSFAQKKEKDKELDKKIFLIDLNEVGKKKPVQDEISFSGNKFKSKVMAEKKFSADAYTVTIDSSSGEKVVTFEAMLKNDSEEELLWTGNITEEDIQGTAILSKKGKTKKEYEFTGALKQKKKK